MMRLGLKNNRRSFRYTDETAAILEEFGNDLDALVTDAYFKLPELKEQIVLEREVLQQVQQEALKVRSDIEEVKLMGFALSSMMDKLLLISRRMDDLSAGRLRL